MTSLAALFGVLGISLSAIFVRLARVSPATATVFRAGLAVPVLLALWWAIRRQDRRPGRARWLAFASGLLLALDLSLWHQSIGLIGATLATVLANTQVVFVGLIAWALYRERPTGLALLVLPIAFGGVALMSGLGRPDAYGDDPVGGVVFGLLSGAAYASFLLVYRASNLPSRQAGRPYGLAGGELAVPVGPVLDATLGTAVGGLVTGLTDPGFSLAVPWAALAWLAALALIAQVIGWLCISVALPRLPALETSVMLLLQPVATTVWAALIFVERLSALQWAGAAMVLGGVATLAYRGSVRREEEVSVEG